MNLDYNTTNLDYSNYDNNYNNFCFFTKISKNSNSNETSKPLFFGKDLGFKQCYVPFI